MGTSPVYDQIGRGYVVTRKPDPRIAGAIRAALGDSRTVVTWVVGRKRPGRPSAVVGTAGLLIPPRHARA